MRHFIARATPGLAGRSTTPRDSDGTRRRRPVQAERAPSRPRNSATADAWRHRRSVSPTPQPARARGSAARIAGSGVLVRVARTVEQVESFRDVWTGMARDEVQTDPDYFLWSLRGEPQVLRPHVLAVDRDGRTESMLVARLSQVRLPCKLGYTTVYAPVVRALSVVHEGLLGLEDDVVADAVLDELFAGLDQRRGGRPALPPAAARFASPRRGAGAVGLPRRVSGSRAPTCAGGSSCRRRSTSTSRRSRPATRKSIRRTASQVEKALGDRISIRSFRDAADLDEYLARRGVGRGADVPAQPRRGLPRRRAPAGAGADADGPRLVPELRPLPRRTARSHSSRARRTGPGSSPCARATTRRTATTGSVRTCSRRRSRISIDDPQLSVFDFGLGDAEYKRKLGHRSIEEGDLVVYARRARPIRINLARTGLHGVSSGVTTSLRKVSLLDTSKQWWRQRATQRDRRP